MDTKLFTTREVADMTGATLRQLQWWDETGFLRAKRKARSGRLRLYTEEQVSFIRKVAHAHPWALHSLRRVSKSLINRAVSIRMLCEPEIIDGVLLVPLSRYWRNKHE